MEFRTLTGKNQEEVTKIFTKHLPDAAYKPVPHMTYLTNIDPSYLVEALTEAFGVVGYGWGYRVNSSPTIKQEERYRQDGTPYTVHIATIVDFELFFRYTIDDRIVVSSPIPSNGSCDNRDIGFALKGAITSALSGAAKYLLWQVNVYKGLHKAGSASPGRGTQKPPEGDPGLYVMTWGKNYKGYTLKELAEEKLGQLKWLVKEGEGAPDRPPPPDVKAAIKLFLESLEAPKKELTEGQKRYSAAVKSFGLTLPEAEVILGVAGKTLKDFEGDVDAAIAILKEHYDQAKE